MKEKLADVYTVCSLRGYAVKIKFNQLGHLKMFNVWLENLFVAHLSTT